MRKILLPLLLCLLLAGCIQSDDGPTAVMVGFTTVVEEERETCGPGVPAEEPAATPPTLPKSYLLASGAGGWGTELHLEEGSAFSGEYHDSDMGVSGPDYPNGTVYFCSFSGQFGAPEQREDGLWALPLASLKTADEPETEWIEDGIRYIGSTAHGLEGTAELVIYPAGFPMEDLPEDFYAGWAQEYLMNETEMPFCVLYNEAEQLAFIEYEFS